MVSTIWVGFQSLICFAASLQKWLLIAQITEVCQQSKVRHKDDFLVAFSPVIAEASATAYKGAPSDVQQRIRRVVDVWRERNVFEEPIQAAIENRIEGQPLKISDYVLDTNFGQNLTRLEEAQSLALEGQSLEAPPHCHLSCLHCLLLNRTCPSCS